MNHLSIFYNISCYNSLVLLTFVSRSSCRITYIYIHKGMKQSSKYKEVKEKGGSGIRVPVGEDRLSMLNN
jgi:hypothetical protein